MSKPIKNQTIAVRIDTDTKAKLAEEGRRLSILHQRGVSESCLVNLLIVEYLEKLKKNNGL